MRDLKECQAEVFRRSEEKIKARKRRVRGVLMTCIPLVLCVTLVAVFLLPGGDPELAEPWAPVGDIDGLTMGNSGSLTEPHVTVEGHRFFLFYTEKADVQRIAEYLNAFTIREETQGTSDEDRKENGRGDKFSASIADSAHSGITITVFTEGETTEFCLTDDLLKNITKNESYPLSPKQTDQLWEVLGIPKEGA